MATENTVTFNMDLKDEDLAVSRSSNSDTMFDTTIGHIEDLIMEEEFHKLQTQFMNKYFHEFEDTEENKFCYTDIHREYTQLVEKYLSKELHKRMTDFSMEEFQRQLISRRDELDGEVFEILMTFSDFLAFKEMMLDFQAEKEGRSLDLAGGLTVTSLGRGGADMDSLGLSCVGVQVTPSNGSLPQITGQGSHSTRLDCGEPMLEGGNTPSSSMDLGSSSSCVQGAPTPLLDRVDMTEEAAMDNPRLDV